jgi:hypothetical protein
MFRHDVKSLMGPIYVHCHTTQRSAAFALMHFGVETGLSPEAVFQKAGQIGLDIESDELKAFIRGYITSRQRDQFDEDLGPEAGDETIE